MTEGLNVIDSITQGKMHMQTDTDAYNSSKCQIFLFTEIIPSFIAEGEHQSFLSGDVTRFRQIVTKKTALINNDSFIFIHIWTLNICTLFHSPI